MDNLTEAERQFILEAIEGWDMDDHTNWIIYGQREALTASLIHKLDLEEVRGKKLDCLGDQYREQHDQPDSQP